MMSDILQISQTETGKQLAQQHSLHVPKDIYALAIDVKIEKPVWLTVMVYDAHNTLRAQLLKAGASGSVIIHEASDKTSPYTISGPIHEGEWTLDISLSSREEIKALDSWCDVVISFNQDADEAGQADTDIWRADHHTFRLDRLEQDKPFQHDKKWYKGDFHTHTIYSDGEMTREENMESAAKQGLDFFVATDHNIVPTSWFAKTDTLVMPGVEVTSTLGHFNIINPTTSPFSANRLQDMYEEDGMNRIIASDYGDAIISINHPFLKGCPWIFEETLLENIDTIEICNDPTYPDNLPATEDALVAWNDLLNDGYRITGIGGSDSHLRPDDAYEGSTEPSLIGDPGTFVYCEQLTASNVMKGVRNGHVTVSRGAFVHFRIGEHMPGDQCSLWQGIASVQVDTDESLYVEWIIDGEIVEKEWANQSQHAFDFTAREGYHWIRADIRYADGRLYGFANPIFFGEKQPEMKKWSEVLG
ncbi:CehA/McbA family metallohydrolase [Lentibacillus sp. N15]|uniref:CehA/McbA family metallohydrolase n=1 Tax=Lentibacillus songyuanensis TaxID=3136161 RepID=UPI0031BB2198